MKSAEEWLSYSIKDFPYYGISLKRLKEVQLDAYCQGLQDGYNFPEEHAQSIISMLKLQIKEDQKLLEK